MFKMSMILFEIVGLRRENPFTIITAFTKIETIIHSDCAKV